MPNEDRRKDQSLSTLIEHLDELDFGIITARGYEKLEKKLDNHANGIENRFHRWFVGGLIAFALMGLACSGSLIGFGILLTEQGNLTNKIQQQRYDSLLETCENQNTRHDDVIKKIDDAVAEVPPPPARQRRAKESAKPFKLILEAAVPHTKDCRAYAHNRVTGGSP